MERNIGRVFSQSAEKFPDKIFIYQPKDGAYLRITYQQACRASQALAGRLARLDLPPTSRVALLSETRYEWLISFLAATLLGWVVVPLDPQLSLPELKNFISHAEPAVIILSENYLPLAERLQGISPRFAAGIYFGPSCPSLPRWKPFEEWTHAESYPPVVSAAEGSEIASIVFTAGTYGTPQAVELTHGNLLKVGAELVEMGGGKAGDVNLIVPPLHHVYGFSGVMAALIAGAGVVIFPALNREVMLQAFRELRPQYVMGVPAFFERVGKSLQDQINSQAPSWVLRRIQRQCASNEASPRITVLAKWLFRRIHRGFGGRLKILGCGGAPLEPRWIRFFNALGFKFYEGYGLTETTGMVIRNYGHEFKVNSIGKPVAGNSIRIDRADEEGIGEICIKGSNVMKAYFRNTAATQAVFDEAGWFHTGDMGHVDTQGFVYFTGRKKDLIVTSNGKNIFPEELEHHFSQIPMIQEICAFGLPRGMGSKSEQIHLQVFPNQEAGAAQGIQDLPAAIKEKIAKLSLELPEYKRPTSVGFSKEAFPKTTTLKVKKYLVKEEHLRELEKKKKKVNGAAMGTFIPESWEASFVLEQLKKLMPEPRPILPDSHFNLDLGLDSLALVELWANLEETLKISIPKDEIVQWHSVADVLGYLRTHPGILPRAFNSASLPGDRPGRSLKLDS